MSTLTLSMKMSPKDTGRLFSKACRLEDENKQLRARIDEKCDAPVGWIDPDKYKAACESKMEFFKTIKELREQNEKLQARVAELEAAARAVVRAAPPSGPLWFQSEQINRLSEAVINPQGKAFITRKQAEALDKYSNDLNRWVDERPEEVRDDGFCKGVRRSAISASNIAKRLRNEAGQAGGQ